MSKVLIADDSFFMRTAIRNMLMKNSHMVVGEACTGMEAVEMYKKLSPDVVTLDVTMEGLSGIDALKEIIAYDPGAKVIMISAMGQQPVVEEAISMGAKGFLLKPLEEQSVVATLSGVI